MTGRWKVNITPAERIARVLVGLELLVTGVTGHYLLYQKLGHVPASLRRRES